MFFVCRYLSTLTVAEQKARVSNKQAVEQRQLNPKGHSAMKTTIMYETLTAPIKCTSQVIEVITVGREPGAIALHPKLPVAYVCNTEGRSLSIIDLHLHRVSAVIPLPIRPMAIVIENSGVTAYITGLDQPLILAIDTRRQRIRQTISAAQGHSLVLSADGARLFVHSNSHVNGHIHEIDTANAKVVACVDTGPFTSGAALSADGRLYYCDYIHHELRFLNTRNTETQSVLTLPNSFEEVTLSPDNQLAYVPYRNADSSTAVIDLGVGKLIDLIPTAQLPHGFVVSADGRLACCCSAGERTVSIIDTVSRRSIHTFTAGEYPQSPVFSRDRQKLYVCDSSADAIWVFALQAD